MATAKELFLRRKRRVRVKIRRGIGDRPRLSVFRSNKNIYAQVIDDRRGNIYAQVIDDRRGVTLVAASTLDKELRARLPRGTDVAAAAEVGKRLAERAVAAGVKEVVFDRGAYMYHGRVKALADGAREGGLSF
jgi:large subunit ribosomal protein L18